MSVTANLLPLLGVTPMLGHSFVPADERTNNRTVILSYRLWQRRFNGDRNIIGTSVKFDGDAWTVVGVMPQGFQFPDRQTEFWVPFGIPPQTWAHRNSHFLKVIGRMKTGTSATEAQSEMTSIGQQIAKEFPATNAKVGITIVPLKDEFLGNKRFAFLLLLGTAGLVLLLATSNVANLLLARATGRSREIAIRSALGAGRSQLIRHVLIESLVLAALAGALGLVIARVGIVALEWMVPAGFPSGLTLNVRVLLFTLLIATISGIAFGLLPALQVVHGTMASRNFTGHSRVRDGLVVSEVAIAFILVVGAALLLRTLADVRAVDPGFRARGMLTAQINVPYARTLGRNQRFYADVLDRVTAMPGVESVGLTSDLPYTSRGNTMGLSIENRPAQDGLGQDALFRLVSADYLKTIDAKLLEGRLLDRRDAEGAPASVVINETLARKYWPQQSALGHRIDTGTGDGQPRWMTIVGVVRDVRERGLDLELKSAVYVPFTQVAITFFQPSEIAIRTSTDPRSLIKDLQRAVWSVDPTQPVSSIRTMEEIVDDELLSRTQLFQMLGIFAALALLLASMGIYSVLSYDVSQRRREIGVRMAIGARRADIVQLILKHSAGLVAAGVVVGVIGAASTTHLLKSLLYGVAPIDPLVFITVPLLLGGTALVASVVPVWRASRVDPAITLRDE